MTLSTKPPELIAGYKPAADGFTYDPEAAEKPIQFAADCLCHVKGKKANQPFILEEWQADVVRTLFGWKRPDGMRRYRKAYIEVPRKNGKSTLVAAIALYMLFCDGEEGAECYCAASDADQASLIFSIAAAMIRKNDSLNSICKIRDSYKRVIFGNSYLRAIPADAGGAHGYNSHFNVCDEVHAWLGPSYEEFYDALQTGLGSRDQPLHIDITTAGYDSHSICRQQHDYAERVRDGKAEDPSFLPVLYAADAKDDWRSESVWRKANPNYGISIEENFLHSEARKAKEQPRYENTFRRLFLNQWTSQKVRWLDMLHWKDCQEGPAIMPGAAVCCGLDLSTTTDLTALCIAERRESGYRLEWRFWLPENRIDHLARYDRVPYRQWIKAGWVETCPGDVIQQDVILQAILERAEQYNLKILGYDPYVATKLAQELEGEHGLVVVKMRQGYQTLLEPSKELEKVVIAGWLDHGGNPVAEWHAESVEIMQDPNRNIRPVRPDKNEYGKKIDGIVAAVMALGSWASAPVDEYEYTGGLAL